MARLDKYEVYDELAKCKKKSEFNATVYKFKNKFPRKQDKYRIYTIALECYCRIFLNYQVYKGSCNQIIKKLQGVKASFDPKAPLKQI